MKWLEVIMVRSTGGNAGLLTETLQELVVDAAQKDGSEEIRIFRRENLETDVCIVLSHSAKKTQAGGSSLGLRIVTGFKEVGLVHHTVWNETTQ